MEMNTCPVCHQPILPQYYFCPNCGTKLNNVVAPLSTKPFTQVWIYGFSIILPVICFIFVSKWPGIKYFKSSDPKAHKIGQIAWILIILSTITTIWLVYVWTQQFIAAQLNAINTDFSGL